MKALYVVRSSCAKEGLCTTEDAQSETGFGGQLGNVAFPGKIMADSENQKLERKDFKKIIERVVGGGGFQTVLSERHSESVRFVKIERHVPCVGPVCDFIQICRVKKLLLADLRDDRWYCREWSHQQ